MNLHTSPFLPLPHLATARPLVGCIETFGWWWWVGKWQPTLVLALGKALSFEAFRLRAIPCPSLPELHNIYTVTILHLCYIDDTCSNRIITMLSVGQDKYIICIIINVLLIAAHSAAVGHAQGVDPGHLGGAGHNAVLQRPRAWPPAPRPSRPFRSVPSSPSPRVRHCCCCLDSALILHAMPGLSGGCPFPGCPGLSGCKFYRFR